jgi:hypothetical protein
VPRLLLAVWIVSTAGMAAARIVYAAAADGIGHPSPFPSILRADDKKSYRYDFPPEDIARCEGVLITEQHPNRALYLLILARQYVPARFEGEFTQYGVGEQIYPRSEKTAPNCSIKFEARSGSAIAAPLITRR